MNRSDETMRKAESTGELQDLQRSMASLGESLRHAAEVFCEEAQGVCLRLEHLAKRMESLGGLPAADPKGGAHGGEDRDVDARVRELLEEDDQDELG